MKTRTITLVAALIVAFCFSGLLVRLNSQDNEIQRQKEQITAMKEVTKQARQAFDRMEGRQVKDSNSADPNVKYINGPIPMNDGKTDLGTAIEVLEIVSKKR